MTLNDFAVKRCADRILCDFVLDETHLLELDQNTCFRLGDTLLAWSFNRQIVDCLGFKVGLFVSISDRAGFLLFVFRYCLIFSKKLDFPRISLSGLVQGLVRLVGSRG